MAEHTASHESSRLLRTVITRLRQRGSALQFVDSTGASLSGGDTLLRALVLRRILRRVAPRDEQVIGLLLPPTVAAAVANLALSLDRRVAVNLNYSLSAELIRGCLADAGIRHVLTSRAFLERVPLDLGATELVYMEDLPRRATVLDKIVAAVESRLPLPLLERVLGIGDIPAMT